MISFAESDIDVSGPNSNLFNQKFVDMVIKNKDVRAIKSGDGKIVLAYTFLNDKTILIFNEEHLIEELLRRMSVDAVK